MTVATNEKTRNDTFLSSRKQEKMRGDFLEMDWAREDENELNEFISNQKV